LYIIQALFLSNYIFVRKEFDKSGDHEAHNAALFPFFIMGCFLTFIELVQMRIKGSEYFKF
jgi:hypothetical protein